MAQLSDRLQRLAPSATLAMSQKSSEMKAQGIDVINLSVGEPDFNTPDHIKAAAKKAIDDNYSRYSPVPGYPDLRKAIAAKLKNENGLDYGVNEILVSNGAKQSVCNTVMALVNDGDEVIIPAPYWVSYPQMVKLAGGVPVIVNAGFEQNFKMTPEQLEAAITPRTRLLILCSPSNPTGSVYSKAELEGLAQVIKRHEDMFVLADEIYEHIIYTGRHESIAQFEGMKERTIFLHGFSKAFAMTGFRIGYACAPRELIEGMMKAHQYALMCAPIVSQEAAIEALANGAPSMEKMRDQYRRRRDFIVRRFNEMGMECSLPRGTFYAFPKVPDVGMDSMEFARYILESARVAVVPGSAFGPSGEGFLRASFSTSYENLVEAADRMEKAVAKLK